MLGWNRLRSLSRLSAPIRRLRECGGRGAWTSFGIDDTTSEVSTIHLSVSQDYAGASKVWNKYIRSVKGRTILGWPSVLDISRSVLLTWRQNSIYSIIDLCGYCAFSRVSNARALNFKCKMERRLILECMRSGSAAQILATST